MAGTTDLQRLVVSMEARYASMERELRKANAVANKQARAIETRFMRMNTSVGASLGRVGGLLAGAFSIRAAQQLIDASTRIENSLKVAGLAGDELTRVYDRLFISAQRNAAPIEALVELYSRAALVQKELGVSTEEMLNFADKVAVALRVSGKSAAESSGALLQLSQALGSGIVRAEEFNSILEGALPIAQAAAAGLREAGGSVARLRQLVVDGKVSSEAFFRAFEAGAPILEDKVAGAELTLSQGFVRLQNVMIDAAGKLDDVTGASRGAGAALNFLAGVIQVITDASSPFMQALDTYTTSMNNLGESFNRLVNDPSFDNLYDFLFVGSADTPAQKRLQAVAAAAAELRDRLREVNAERQAAAVGTAQPMTPELDQRFGDAFGANRTVSLSDYDAPSSTSKGKTDAEKAADKIEKVKEELAFEAAQLTRTAREQEIYNQLKQAGVDLNSAEGRAIAEATGKLYDQQQAFERNVRAMDDLRDAARDMASSFISGLREGKSATESLGDALENLADRIISSGLDSLIAGLFGQTGTPGAGFLSQLAGALFGGARATGGPINPGKVYKVHKDELIVPRVPGTVIPAAQAGKGGGGPTVISIDVSGARGNAEIMEMVAAGVRRGIGEYDKALPARVGQIREAPRRRSH